MQCAFCKEVIDDDSFYCDMCGEEIKSCPACKKTGKGKVCTACGTPLVTLKSLTGVTGGNEKGEAQTSPHMGANVTGSSDAKGGTYRLHDDEPAKSKISTSWHFKRHSTLKRSAVWFRSTFPFSRKSSLPGR